MVEILSKALRFDLTKGELRLLLALAAAGGAIEPCSNAALAQAAGMDRSYVRRARQGLLSKGLVEMQGSRLQIPGCEAMTPLEGGQVVPRGGQGVPSGGDRTSPGGDRLSPEVGTGRPQKWGQDVPRGDRVSPPPEQSSTWKEESSTEKGSEGESGSLYLSIYAPKKDEELERGRADREKEPLSPFERLFAAWNDLIDGLPAGLARRPVRHRTASPAQRRAVAQRLAEGYSEELLKLAMERYVETAATPGMFSPGFGRWRLQDLLSRRESEDWVESLLQADWRKRFGPKDDLSAAPPPTLRRAEWTKPTQLSLGLEEPDAEVGGEDEDLLNGILKGWLQACPTAKALSIFDAQDFAMRLEEEFGDQALSKLPEVLERLAARAEEASIPAKTILKLTMRDDTFAALISRRPAGMSKSDRITREIEERTQRVIDQRARRKGK